MFDKNKSEVSHLLDRITEQLEIVCERCRNVQSVNDFLGSNEGMSLLDGVCMKLIAVGESIKNLDKLTERSLLVNYPQIPWREVMGMRDIIVHHYFEIDADVIFATVRENVPELLSIISLIKKDIEAEKAESTERC